MRIKKLVVRDMWSFGGDEAVFEDLAPTTVIIGRNNAGKSNVFRALRWLVQNQFAPWATAIPEGTLATSVPESHRPATKATPVRPAVRAEFVFTSDEIKTVLNDTPSKGYPEDWKVAAANIIGKCVRFGGDWETPGSEREKSLYGMNSGLVERLQLEAPKQDESKYRELSKRVSEIVTQLANRTAPKIISVSGWRTLSDTMKTNLGKWKDPPPNEHLLQEKFDRILDRFREFTGLDGATLHIAANTLSIRWNKRYLESRLLGDGIEHLLVLAYEFENNQESIFLIEEPETHLHPTLQRHLLRMINDMGGQNQVILTTHSPVFLDAGRTGCAYRVEYDGYTSTATKCCNMHELHRVLDDLGSRASDILQANYVIWVEGPTDRMFLNHCFKQLGFELTEGIDYQIAFYGGRLRSHVTLDAEAGKCACSDLVNLLSLSRRVAMVCDSDRAAPEDPIDETKKRLEEECKKAGGFYWETDGREIENYIPNGVLTKTFRRLLGDQTPKIDLAEYQRLADRLAELPKPKWGKRWITDYAHNKVDVMSKILDDFPTDKIKACAELLTKLDGLRTHIQAACANAEPAAT